MEDVIKKTQAELGAVIQTPKLTEKLLSRPPFRFLHDVVVAVLQSCSFPEGLYTDAQLNSANVMDKKAKLEFLEQLIAAVEAGKGQAVPVRATKIVAGEEPEKTNALLQGLAACAGLPAEQKKAAVEKAKGRTAEAPAPAESAPKAASSKAAAPASAPAAPAAAESEEERQRRHEEERRRRHEEKKEKAAKAAAAAAEAEEQSQEASPKQPGADAERRRRREEKRRESISSTAIAAAAEGAGIEITSAAANAVAPAPTPNATPTTATGAAMTATARKAPPRTKPTHEVIDAQRGADAAPAAGVIRESKRGGGAAAGAAEESDEDDAQDWQRVAAQYDAKPSARTAAVAEGTEVRGMLGQQALKAKKDQEEAQRRGEAGDGAATAATHSQPANGGIVIRNSRNTVSRGGGGHALGDGDLNQLREQLQMLTKASNPLGKFLEAIHDDIDSMTRELEMWRSESRSQALAAAEARRQTEESLQEIHANLQNLEDAISDQILKTNNLRQTILSNDGAMETMMKTIVNPDIAAQ